VIHLIYGKDRYLVRQTLQRLRDELRAKDDMLDANTSVLDGAQLTPGELLANAQAVPFLAASRLVIVEGLLAHIGGGRRGRRGKKAAEDDPLAPWEAAATQLGDAAQTPATTTLVFIDDELTKSNPALAIFAKVGRVQVCDGLDASQLRGWIEEAATARGVRFDRGALQGFAQAVGTDVGTIESELDKLAAYADGAPVDAETVGLLVSTAQERKVWDMTDAVVAGDERKALSAMRALLDDGEPPPLLTFMLVRQYRQLVIARDMRERGARRDDIAAALGTNSYRAERIAETAGRYGWDTLRAAYATLLDADLAVKRGLRDDAASLQLAVHELCRLAPGQRRATPAAPRR